MGDAACTNGLRLYPVACEEDEVGKHERKISPRWEGVPAPVYTYIPGPIILQHAHAALRSDLKHDEGNVNNVLFSPDVTMGLEQFHPERFLELSVVFMSVNMKPIFVAVVHLYARESVQRPKAVQVRITVEVLCGALDEHSPWNLSTMTVWTAVSAKRKSDCSP